MSDCCANPYIGINDEPYNPGEVRLYGRPCNEIVHEFNDEFSVELREADDLRLDDEQVSKISKLVQDYVAKTCSGAGQAVNGDIILKVDGCQLRIDPGDNVEISSIGVIYGYSYEGHCYKLPKPQIMYLPVFPQQIVDSDCGCDCGYSRKLGYHVWPIDKLQRVIALDVRSDDIKTLILDENLPGNRSPLLLTSIPVVAATSSRLSGAGFELIWGLTAMFKSIVIVEGGLKNSKIWWFERFRQLTDNIILVQPYDVTWERSHIDQFYICDYTQWEMESVRLAGILRDEGVEVIFPLCEGATKYGNDLRNLLGFPPITTIDAGYYTNKQKMRRYCRSKGVLQPKTSLAERYEDTEVASLAYPLVVKPAEMMGSLGVRLVSNQTELADAIALAKIVDFPGEELRGRYGASDKVLVEEFILGKEYSVECIVVDGTPTASMITEKFKSDLPYFDEIGHIANPSLDQELQTKIFEFTSQLIGAMQFCNGICHIEIISNANGIYLVEIAARPAGCWIPYLHMLGGDFDIVRVILAALSRTQNHLEFERKHESAGVFFPFVTCKNKDASKHLMKNLPRPPKDILLHREATYIEVEDAFIVPGNVTDRLGMMIVVGDYESIREYFSKLSDFCVNYSDHAPLDLIA